MTIRVTTLETGKRANPLRICKGCGCGIRSISYCGPCAEEKRIENRKRYLAKVKARKAEQGVSA